ncbi:glycosyltransferase [Isoptericola sp. b441]|uniref:D-inositol 3-phosphate glycosyltransferase n=1 Tax=Actinotalea lenta TaxID=3064654 RepID=A0ABT9DCD4_9CELL|nr:glycosyltransferase [Isoptericola sp. b441]MDO8108555.1 glycosyltransferase [Isoptericola sp. b441]
MRVVQVSAHYPPNFVSGGTLVPQRIARHLAAQGHESLVYAGHLDESRAPLDTWEDVDEQGVRVRWVVTTPWTAWSDPLNTLNPAVEADAERWFAEVRPDVVHVHALQTLGGGVLRAAKRSGAAVVVTMHDFWWTCARQFLMPAVGPECSLVVSCGSCPCAVDHAWLERRNSELQAYLEHADLVLAPSESAARVLAANGVAADRIEVDENGVQGVSGPAAPRGPRTGPVRFLYAGGDDPMKGVETLLAAVPGLPDDAAWTLDLYGVAGRTGLPSGVRAHPPFGRDELGAVLADHDVLVLPSRLRESHSILTREALQAGLAVVCTESLGPEEVVEHGVTGMVVPIDGAAELAEAMGVLARDPALVHRMGEAGRRVRLRDWQDQLDGLERRYQELADAGGRSQTVLHAAELALLHDVVVITGINGAPLRYRGQLPAEALALHGHHVEVRHYRDPELPDLLDSADAVVLYRVPATHQVLDLIAAVRRRERTVPVLFDVDDLIFDPQMGQVEGLGRLSRAEQDLWWRGVARYRTTMEQCDAYVGSTALLCERATALTGMPAFRFANGVGTALARVSDAEVDRPRADGPLRIGYFSGTKTHDADWASIEPAVAQVLRERPEVELWLGGLVTPGPLLDDLADRVRRLPMVPWHTLPAYLRDVDVNLAPLVLGTPFNEAKSAIKWLEAALVQTPTVASPTQPFLEAITEGRTGLLATDHDDWVRAIGRLLDDDLLRRRVGVLAEREALLRWGPHLQGLAYQRILVEVARIRRADGPRVTSWEPVLDDEPLSAADAWVEPLVVPRVRQSDGRLRQRWRAVRRVYAAGGPREVTRRVAARLRA